MAKKKCKCDEGVPEWVVTFGDMMSLLLTFFILLAAFSELKKPREFQDLVKSLQVAFGITGGGGTSPDPEAPFRSLPRILEDMQLQPLVRPSQRPEPSITKADRPNSPRMREGGRVALTAPIPFRPGQFRMESEQEEALELAVTDLRGKNHVLEIRGNADASDLESADFKAKVANSKLSKDEYLLDLSFKRASAVSRYLIEKRGLEKRRLRIMALSDHEPEKPELILGPSVGNRRVDLIQTEKLIQDLAPK